MIADLPGKKPAPPEEKKLPKAASVPEAPKTPPAVFPPSAPTGMDKELLIAGLTVVAGAVHAATILADEPEEENLEGEEGEKPEAETAKTRVDKTPSYSYSEVGGILSETPYYGEVHTAEIVDRYIALWRGIFSGPVGEMYYYDAQGNLLLATPPAKELVKLKEKIQGIQAQIKEERKKGKKKDKKKLAALEQALQTEKQKIPELRQKMHNANREALPVEKKVLPTDPERVGYPFVGVPSLPNVPETPGQNSITQVVLGRLHEDVKTVQAPHYFEDQSINLYAGIERIAKAYDIPRAIAFGLAANESGYDKEAESKAGARGIYQLTEAGYGRGLAYAKKHPELSASFRTGDLPAYEVGWKNRLVSAELFCAHYRSLQDELSGSVGQLEEFFQKKDPDFAMGTLIPLATINAYNAGATRIKRCIERFLALPEDKIQGKIGKPPYGLDIWLSIITMSYGAKIDDSSTGVGQDVFMYPYKVLAMGSVIMDTENALGLEKRLRSEGEDETPSIVAEDAPAGASSSWLRWLSLAATLLGTTRVAYVIRKEEEHQQPVTDVRSVTRRRMLLGSLAGLGLVTPAVALATTALEEIDFEGPPEPIIEKPLDLKQETYPEAVSGGKAELDLLYATLKEEIPKGVNGWTPDELDEIVKYKMPYQRTLLAEEFESMLGKDFLKEFEESTSKPQSKRKHLYKKGGKLQRKYLTSLNERGHLAKLKEDDSSVPYFCEQVGQLSGTGNDADSLWTRKEFIPILGTLVELVNHQIDKFNVDPTILGADKDFPKIPHISAIKISGAFRDMEQTMRMIEAGQARRTTKGTSAHWTANALDLGSPATVGGHMVRFVEAMQDRDGTVAVQAGEKLSNDGFGMRTREYLYRMIGRALFAMKDSLKAKYGITLLPLHEPSQTNWHVVIKKK